MSDRARIDLESGELLGGFGSATQRVLVAMVGLQESAGVHTVCRSWLSNQQQIDLPAVKSQALLSGTGTDS